MCIKSLTKRKTALLNENEAVMRDSDIKLQGEIETLRSILFSKVGLLDDSTNEIAKETRKGSVSVVWIIFLPCTLNAWRMLSLQVKSHLTDEAQRQLDSIVEQCKKYINGVKDAQVSNPIAQSVSTSTIIKYYHHSIAAEWFNWKDSPWAWYIHYHSKRRIAPSKGSSCESRE